MKKLKDLSVITLIYIIAFVVGFIAGARTENIILKFFIFDTVATIVTFVFSVVFRNSSVYDPYWSVTPMIMAFWLFFIRRAFLPYQILFLAVFSLWSIRLTANWISVFTDFNYEDWRYRKFRNETPRLLWPIVNFFGIQYVPTVVVFLGMLPLFDISLYQIGRRSLFGIGVILFGVALEYFADKQMHAFLSSERKGSVCKDGLWKYSRHPNYLGEITVWLGVYLTMLPYSVSHWYYVAGFLGMVLLFNVISIPLMEKRQCSRRPEYLSYIRTTSRLLLLPINKTEEANEYNIKKEG